MVVVLTYLLSLVVALQRLNTLIIPELMEKDKDVKEDLVSDSKQAGWNDNAEIHTSAV